MTKDTNSKNPEELHIKQKTTITKVQQQRIIVQITEQCGIRDNHGPDMKRMGNLREGLERKRRNLTC